MAERLLNAELGGRFQYRLGERIDVLALPSFGAWTGRQLSGLAAYARSQWRAELAALCVASGKRMRGLGGALVEAVASTAASRGALELWLVTTNDNLDALRLYQRHGFRLSELHPGAVDEARAKGAPIPLMGQNGIPMRDELVLVRPLV